MSLPFYLKVSPPFPLSRYTYYALEFLEGVSTRDSKKTMGQFLEVCPKRLCISTVGKRTDLFARDPYKVPITDFFGAVRNVELTREVTNVTSEVTHVLVDRRHADGLHGLCALRRRPYPAPGHGRDGAGADLPGLPSVRQPRC